MAYPERILQSYPWLFKAAIEYTRDSRTAMYTQTAITRGSDAIEVLDKHRSELGSKPKIMIVGLGLGRPIACSYEPFRIAAHLEAMGINCEMTLVDISEEVIMDVYFRDRLFVLKENSSDQQTAWGNYLRETRQRDYLVTTNVNGLRFNFDPRRDPAVYAPENLFRIGIYAADIPKGFRHKRSSGEIRLLEADVAKADLGFKWHDFVDFTYTVYQMPRVAQRLAIGNIALSVRKGGYILVDDIDDNWGNPLFTELGGWLDEKLLAKYGLEREILHDGNDWMVALLKKVK